MMVGDTGVRQAFKLTDKASYKFCIAIVYTLTIKIREKKEIWTGAKPNCMII